MAANCKILKLVTNEINNHILKNKVQLRENETFAPTVETFDATMTKREENDTDRDNKKRLSSDLNDSTLNGEYWKLTSGMQRKKIKKMFKMIKFTNNNQCGFIFNI